jgi:putative ABC transport system ATP-binding protein
MGLLTSLNQQRGITIVMVTHETAAASYAHRIVRLLDGRIESDARNRNTQ